jgi:hypothetical protein
LVSLSKLPNQSENLQFQIQFANETWKVDLQENEIRSKSLQDDMKKKATQKGETDRCDTYAGTVNGNDSRFYLDSETFLGKVYQKSNVIILEPLTWILGKQNAPKNV